MLDQPRSTQRYEPLPAEDEQILTEDMSNLPVVKMDIVEIKDAFTANQFTFETNYKGRYHQTLSSPGEAHSGMSLGFRDLISRRSSRQFGSTRVNELQNLPEWFRCSRCVSSW